MVRAAIMSASAIFSSAVFSLVVDDVDVLVVGNEGDATEDVGRDEVVLLSDRTGHTAPTGFREAIDALMKEASRPFPHHVVGSAFRKH